MAITFAVTFGAPVVTGFSALKTGGGGYILGMDIHRGNNSVVGGTGAVAGTGDRLIRTDVGGAYRMRSGETVWTSILTKYSIAGLGPNLNINELGVCDIQICPSDPSRYYMLWEDPNQSYISYRLFRSNDRGDTWAYAGSFATTGGFRMGFGGSMSADNHHKFSQYRIGIDPYNADVVYIGSFSWNILQTNGVYRTLNGGTSWSLVSGMAAPRGSFGVAGIRFDLSAGFGTVGGITRALRAIIPVSNSGLWEMTDGDTWAKVASSADPTPASTSASVTTVATNSVIYITVICSGEGSVASITASGAGSLTFTARSASVSELQAAGVFTFWAVAASIGTYNITVNFDDGASAGFGPNGQSVLPIAIAGANVSGGASTIFDVANAAIGQIFTGAGTNAPVTVTTASSLVIGSAFSSSAAPATYTTGLTSTGNYAFQVYKVETAGAKTVNIASEAWAYSVDVIKYNGTTLTVTLGTAHYLAGTSSQGGPSAVYTADMDPTGTYLCASKHRWMNSSNYGAYFRYKKGGTVQKLNGTGSTANKVLNEFGATSPGSLVLGSIACDPRASNPGVAVMSLQSQENQGQQTFNLNAATPNDITWVGNTTPVARTLGTSDVVWLNNTNGSTGQIMIGLDGKYHFTNGVMYFTGPSNTTWDTGSPVHVRNILTAGVEEMVAMDVLAAPGSPQPCMIYQDRNAMYANEPNYPTTTAFNEQFSGYQGDWSGTTPSYYFMVARQEIGPLPGGYLAYSNNFGATWTKTAGQLSSPYDQNAQGGCCAVLKYTSNTVASLIVAGLGGTFMSQDNGQTWVENVPATTGLPNAAYAYYQQARTKPFCGSKNVNGVGWAYAPSVDIGLFRTTNGGVNWTKVSTVNTSSAGAVLINPHGYPDDLFLCSALDFNAAQAIRYSSNANAGTVTFSTLNALITNLVHFTVGKVEAGGSYPTLWALCSYNAGTFGWYKSTNKGVTWTFLGARNEVAGLNSIDYPQLICGDWERAGTFYQIYAGTSIGKYVTP